MTRSGFELGHIGTPVATPPISLEMRVQITFRFERLFRLCMSRPPSLPAEFLGEVVPFQFKLGTPRPKL